VAILLREGMPPVEFTGLAGIRDGIRMSDDQSGSKSQSSKDGNSVDFVGGMPYRTLGTTGEKVSLVGLGGWHVGRQADEQESIDIIRTALDNGINFLDNSWDYHKGVSEIRMGKALADGYRQKAFLMTKVDGRTREAAARQLEESLSRLRVETIDLLQFHEVIHEDDPERIFAPGGAMEAVLAAKEAGKVRYIGFTGHKDPSVHLKMLETATAHGFRFDAVQMPLGIMDAHYQSFQSKVLPLLVDQGIAALGMKSLGFSFFLMSQTITPMEYLHYSMNLPLSTLVTGCDSMRILNQSLEAARSFKPMSDEEVSDLLERTREAGSRGRFEMYKTSILFDDTTYYPELLV
jgi:diketogulonate reductase-like aldo/keto reductase